ncbi:MAG TPA: S-methyl-5-thioribose-1-phosphate isomerase, partial [Campylobacterales bacterium]|nr:S-methyl-5-thioribose-1-phosphate isomerase [Campylobacterales bacterium]
MKEALWLDGGELFVIDQTKLPHLCESKKLASSKECALAIADMTVRGAGVIGNVGAFGAAFAIAEHGGDVDAAKEALISVREARPTAVNLAWAVDRVTSAAQSSDEPSCAAFDEAVLIIDEEIA